MVHIITGLQGSGKTKQLIDSVHEALKNESGSMVCIEKGHTLRFDLDHRVRPVSYTHLPLRSRTAAIILPSATSPSARPSRVKTSRSAG